MKKVANLILSMFSPLAAVPTAWAIFAGITGRAAFPMQPVAAGIGAIAIIVVDIAAAMLITDVYKFNQSAKNQTERTDIQPLWWSWSILILAIISEIVLSLIIVVFKQLLVYGVIVFPMMTLAGVFTVAVRTDLIEREAERKKLRAKSQKTTRIQSETAKKSKGIRAQSGAVWPKKCKHCDEVLEKPQSVGGHMKKHHPDKCLQKAYSVGYVKKDA